MNSMAAGTAFCPSALEPEPMVERIGRRAVGLPTLRDDSEDLKL